jgi:hypothetical protein
MLLKTFYEGRNNVVGGFRKRCSATGKSDRHRNCLLVALGLGWLQVLGYQPLPGLLVHLLPSLPSRAVELGFAVAVLIGIAVVLNLQSFASWLLQTYTGES